MARKWNQDTMRPEEADTVEDPHRAGYTRMKRLRAWRAAKVDDTMMPIGMNGRSRAARWWSKRWAKVRGGGLAA